MNKAELISVVADKTGFTKKDTAAVVEASFEAIMEAVAKGDDVQIIGFGTFKKGRREERKALNPATGEKITCPAKNVVKYKVGKAFTAAINK